MSERRNVQTTKISVELPVLLRTYLEDLVRTGLYGSNIEQVAERIIADEIRRQVFEGHTLQRRHW